MNSDVKMKVVSVINNCSQFVVRFLPLSLLNYSIMSHGLFRQVLTKPKLHRPWNLSVEEREYATNLLTARFIMKMIHFLTVVRFKCRMVSLRPNPETLTFLPFDLVQISSRSGEFSIPSQDFHFSYQQHYCIYEFAFLITEDIVPL